MKNPWEDIHLSDYENHMKLDQVMQLQAMNDMMKAQFYAYPVRTVMILGAAGGNGLEHIDPQRIDKVYGVDINQAYLQACVARYAHLNGTLSCLCVDLTAEAINLPSVEMVIANLLIEYIGYAVFKKVILQIEPLYVSCIIQVNLEDGFISSSPYLSAFKHLDRVHHQVDEEDLVAAMAEIGYCILQRKVCPLPNGKQLVQLDLRR